MARNNQRSLRGERGVSFLIREYLVDEVEFISQVSEESVWLTSTGSACSVDVKGTRSCKNNVYRLLHAIYYSS